MPSDVSTGAGADVSVDEGHPKFRRISRQMSKMRLRRLKKDPKVSNRMIGVDKGPYKCDHASLNGANSVCGRVAAETNAAENMSCDSSFTRDIKLFRSHGECLRADFVQNELSLHSISSCKELPPQPVRTMPARCLFLWNCARSC